MNKIQDLKMIEKNIEEIRKKAYRKGRFSLFDTNFAERLFDRRIEHNNINYMYNLIEEWDHSCNLPYDFGVTLEKLSEDNTIMVKRISLNFDKNARGLAYSNILEFIMNKGLRNSGHINAVGGSAIIETPHLSLAMTPLVGISGYINFLGNYQSNDATILAVFPKNLVNSEGNVANGDYSKIYYFDDDDILDSPIIKPEYIWGALIKKDNGLDEFYNKEEIIDYYDSIKNSKMQL